MGPLLRLHDKEDAEVADALVIIVANRSGLPIGPPATIRPRPRRWRQAGIQLIGFLFVW